LKLVQEENVSLNEDTKCLQSEVAHLTERLAMHEREYNGLHDRNVAQEKNITELNLLLCETNDKVNALQPQVRRERTARQKAETEVDELETEVERLNEELKKAAVQREASVPEKFYVSSNPFILRMSI
jgi:chromosome segregation ATPase